MLKKTLRWFLGIVLFLLIALVGLVVYVNSYLESNQEKLLHEYMATKGMSVAMREVDLKVWKGFPEVSLTVDSLIIRDTTKTLRQEPLLQAQRITSRVSLKDLMAGRIRLKEITLIDATLHLESDSSGIFNTGYLADKDTSTVAEPGVGEEGVGRPGQYFSVDWEGLHLGLDRVDIRFIHPLKKKRIALLARRVEAYVDRNDLKELCADAMVDLDIGLLALNTEKGSYLENSTLRGPLDLVFATEQVTVNPNDLDIGGQNFRVSANIRTLNTDTSHIYIAAKSITYDSTSVLLPEELREKIAPYHVSGRFPVAAHIATPLIRGSDPEITLDFSLTGQDVALKQYNFRDVHMTGTLINRLETWEGGLSDSRKNIRVTGTGVSAVYLGSVLIETPYLKVAVAGKDPILKSDLHFSGAARAVSDYLKNDAFFFRRGRFTMDAKVHASLLSFEEVVGTTDADITFHDTEVSYDPAGVNFPFDKIHVNRAGDDISYNIKSTPLSTGFAFELFGKIDNIAPLLINQSHGRINTDVTLISSRLDWTDFRALFGQDGRLVAEEDPGAAAGAELGDQEAELSDAAQVQAMKAALLGLEEAFHPNITARIDTVAYYDIFDLTKFSTGLHFTGDTLVLEKTTFDWSGSEMNFGARLNMDVPGETPFALDFLADHLNVNKVRSTLDYFGLQLPKGLEELPQDMHIDFSHSGKIADSIGIVPGFNQGLLKFDDGRDQLFSGEIEYHPVDEELQTNVKLEGDPRVVNVIFASENFYFGEGSFGLDIALKGVPEDLPQLLKTSYLNLRIQDSKIHYLPSDVYIPVKNFGVELHEQRAEYVLNLVTDSTNRAVLLQGYMDNIGSFLFPDTTAQPIPFALKADLTSQVLSYSDITNFIQPGKTRDTTEEMSLRSILSATGGVFNSFRPDMNVLVDTFWLSPETPLVALKTGMHVRDEKELVLEKTGFELGGGEVEIDAVYTLDEIQQSPFAVEWAIKDIDLTVLMGELMKLRVPGGPSLGTVKGTVSLNGNMTGILDETDQKILFDSTQGIVTYDIRKVALSDWPQLDTLGQKVKMRKRFQRLGLSPLSGQLRMNNGILEIPRTEVQSTALHLFVEGEYSLRDGPDILVSVPVFPNIGRGVLKSPPPPTGYADTGLKVYLVATSDETGAISTSFRLGRKKYYKNRGRLAELKALKARMREVRKAAKRRR